MSSGGKGKMLNTKTNQVTRIHNRDDSMVNFDASKIEDAIFKALEATKTGDRPLAAELTQRVVNILNQRFSRTIPA